MLIATIESEVIDYLYEAYSTDKDIIKNPLALLRLAIVSIIVCGI